MYSRAPESERLLVPFSAHSDFRHSGFKNFKLQWKAQIRKPDNQTMQKSEQNGLPFPDSSDFSIAWISDIHCTQQIGMRLFYVQKSLVMDGWVDGSKSQFKDCLQQSKMA